MTATAYGDHTANCDIGDGAADVDYFTFSGDNIRLTVSGQSTGLDPRVEVLDPDDQLLGSREEEFAHPPPASGGQRLIDGCM